MENNIQDNINNWINGMINDFKKKGLKMKYNGPIEKPKDFDCDMMKSEIKGDEINISYHLFHVKQKRGWMPLIWRYRIREQ